jgi:hypothetical protein
MEHLQGNAQPFGSLRLRREAERDAAGLDALFAAADALRDRRLGDEERACDLRSRKPSHSAQGQRNLRRRRERGMCTGEEQGERVVVFGALISGRRRKKLDARRPCADGLFAAAACMIAAELVSNAS